MKVIVKINCIDKYGRLYKVASVDTGETYYVKSLRRDRTLNIEDIESLRSEISPLTKLVLY